MDDNNVKYSPYHEWGDTDFDWKALVDASEYISNNVRKWGRVGIWTKEKYGTLRVSTTCAYFREYDFIHHFFYPGYCRYMFPKWFRKYIDWPFGGIMKKLGVVWLLQKYQHTVLKFFWLRAAKKWPHIAEEILDEYDWIVGDDK